MPTNLTETATWTTPVPVPVDTDAGVAASVNNAFQALANRTSLLRGAYKLHSYLGRKVDDVSDANGTIDTTSSLTYDTLVGWSPGAPIIAVPAVGDLILVAATLNIQWSGGGNAGGYVKLAYDDGSSVADMAGAKYHQTNNLSGIGHGITLTGYHLATSTDPSTILLQGKCVSGSDTLTWFGQASIFALVLRAT